MTHQSLAEYRNHCVAAEQKAQEDYDKAVLSLSGGALGISFAFLKDVVGPGIVAEPRLLVASWLSWGGSLVATLASYWFSQRALRTAIEQVDSGKINEETPGRTFTWVTSTLNAIGGLLFVSGVALIVFFVAANIDRV